ncbi:DUF1343 domain-containing protein [Lentisphaerota bacterium ZTH]|nr:DUF1343 domain-containing protein [Lentisphaerota bacterium]WET05650.1 DUF1343 domain-containing protein [Lentisphaerota bacterium ZTH]
MILRKNLLLKLLTIALMVPFCLHARVYTGLEVFLSKYTGVVKNKRVGLITNPTGVNAQLLSAVDLLKQDRRVNLVALFAPEHGIRGNLGAGEHVRNQRDAKTGLPVYSLYGGRDHRPPPGSLNNIDVLLYCIQDVGARSYTYIWHLAECMSAAAAAGKTVIVLDVPNPLGAVQVDGPTVEPRFKSFIGLYPIPYVYGLTVGELARYLNREEKINCKLYIVPMANYRRGMNWHDTGLPWVPTSPNIPSPESACCYSITGPLGTLSSVNIGVGGTLPFQVVTAPWINGENMAYKLNVLRLPGIRFRPIYYKPTVGLFRGQNTQGVQIHITDVSKLKPITTCIAIMDYLRKNCKEFRWKLNKYRNQNKEGFDKAMGTASIRQMVIRGSSWQSIARSWQRFDENFKTKAQKYKIYK